MQPVTTNRAPSFFAVGEREDRVDALAPCFFDECTGVDDHDVGVRGVIGALQSVAVEETDDLVGVDLVLRTPEGLDVEALRLRRN